MKYPKWFWFSMVFFIIAEFVAIPLLGMFGKEPNIVIYGILYIALIGYPLFVVLTLIMLNITIKLNMKRFFASLALLFIPIIAYFPFWQYVNEFILR